MLKKKDQLYQEYEIQQHEDFFVMLRDVFHGVILRKHLIRFFPNHSEKLIQRWIDAGIIESSMIWRCRVYRLRGVQALGTDRKVELTSSMLLRAYLRLEYFFSLGLQTPQEILCHIKAGNDRRIIKGSVQALLERYQEALEERGITVPYLDCPENARTIERLVFKNIFISKIQCKDGILKPCLTCYLLRDRNSRSAAEDILEAYREWVAMLHVPDGPRVQPVIHIVSYKNEAITKAIHKQLLRQPEFMACELEDMAQIFPCHHFNSPFSGIVTDKLV